MTIGEIMMCSLIVLLMVCILASVIFNLRETAKKNEGMLKIQIEASKVKSVEHITKLSFDECIKIMNNIIGFYVSNTILLNGLQSKDSNTISAVLDDLIIEISTQVRMSMSEELTNAILNYVTKDYLNNIIKDTVRIVLMAKINDKRL